ncbi:GAP family protein [Streptomyces sp. NPDC048507]|uniref:GAP family protein n=1 Tax=Streptomyces sp. NPDC048507 TaxID=3365560 RepID=UPI00371EAE05
MSSEAMGAVLPAALAIALSPFPVIGIVLVLSGAHGRRNGLLFAVGWLAALAVAAALAALLLGGADDPDSPSSAVADWGRVLAGAALLVLGVRTWCKRPRGGERAEPPRWTASLDDVTAGRALLLGALLSGANPKNLVLTASAVASIVEAGAHGGGLVATVVVFLLVASCTVLGAVGVHLFAGRRGAAFLDGVGQFMVDNSTVITVIVLLLLGAGVLGGGLSGLSR